NISKPAEAYLHIKGKLSKFGRNMAATFDFRSTNLPIGEVIPQVRQQLALHNTLILTTPPGAGKSTVVPLALLREPWLGDKKIVMLEPRRLAASSIAHRMASLL